MFDSEQILELRQSLYNYVVLHFYIRDQRNG